MAASNVTLRVKKGVKVNIEEVDDLRSPDPRIPNNRDIQIFAPKELKIALAESGPADLSAQSSLLLRCG